MAETRIEVTRRRLHRRGGRFEWYWHYYVKGPDTHVVGGRVIPRRFDNRSIVELRRVLKRHYGRDVRIVETWKEVR